MKKMTNACRIGRPWKQLLLLCSLLLLNLPTWAQTKVTGVVKDPEGNPLSGVTVQVKGSTVANTTNTNGTFEISAPAAGTLVFTMVGFAPVEQAVANRTTLSVTLTTDSELVEEVVVIGYNVVKKTDVTGSVASIGTKELKAMPVKDALQAMQGKVAGVDITSNQRPGTTGSIQIRGLRSLSANNAPLYVVDGMVLQSTGIDNINPSDIESIDILKDASATAIYGARGANGVILVTTKKGKSGRLLLNYAGTATAEKMYDVTEYMDAAAWLDYARLAKTGSTTPNYDSDFARWGSVAASWANIAKGWTQNNTVWDPSAVGNFDWGAEGRKDALSTEHTLSLSGGGESSQGYGSFGYIKQDATQPGQLYERFTSKVSFEGSPTKWFKMGTSINLAYSDQDYGYNYSRSVTGAGDYYSALRAMLPWTVPYDENGNYIRNPAAGDINIINPIRELEYNTNQRQAFVANGSFYGQFDLGEIFKPLKGLRYRLQFGPEYRHFRLGIANAAAGINGDGNNAVTYSPDRTLAWTLDNLIYYDRDFGKDHRFGLTLLQSASARNTETATMRATDVYSANELWYNIASGGFVGSYGTGLSEEQMESYMARVNYAYKDRYLIAAFVRWDGASVLAPGHQWASFPSASIGWRIDQEDFMKEVRNVNNLKLRFGAGVVGNAGVSPYQTKGLLTQNFYNWSGTTSLPGYVASDPSAANPQKMANPELGWERTTQYNFGLDYGFFNNRINGAVDFYKTYTDDLIMTMSLPSVLGFPSTLANVGKTKGWGIDLQLNTVNIEREHFQWATTLTWSKDRGEIVQLNNGRTEDVNNRWFVGQEIAVPYDFVYDGIWKTSEAEEAATYGRKPGQIRVKDISGPDGVPDGVIDGSFDRQIVGSYRPDWSGGITNTFNYKNFELSFFIYSRWGFTVNAGAATLDGRYMQRELDYFIPGENEDAEYYLPGSNGEAADTYASSMNYRDGSFIKLRNVSFGYNVPAAKLQRLGISNLKLYGQLMNPAMLYSKVDFLDTDLSSYNNNTTQAGSAITIRGAVLGLSVGF
ncbi:TonB-dependent receptor [Sphingobacterium oryzagri]|uniref:TonB-dependent receptor n=1 Tax=Sphingobacterium oryzagri TaxID=3025669 RepID=A0ABY7WIT4_9SPHI|nr:TonB-dependent receptor [Sphingobacterium sp. KACC 22765]WDF68278.1 TonB-dependent receptor [Sphingobacterium sp. KACC 22765]